MICCVIPAYRARLTICGVVRRALDCVDIVIVVDDKCPDGSADAVEAEFGSSSRVIVLRRDRNGGVGAAMKTGLAKGLELQATVIVKLDADGQMDPAYIPSIVACFEADPSLAYLKGNRFVNSAALKSMPKIRLVGNAMLSIFVKFASGYWNLLDPTNGYTAFSGRHLELLDWQDFADSYFFEISVIGQLGLRQATIGEMEMPASYGEEQSSLSIRRVLWEFPPKLLAMFWRRILLQYFLFDVNLGSLYLFFGLLLMIGGFAGGVFEWVQTHLSGEPRTTGSVMLVVLPALIGVQLILNALMYDVQFAPKTAREFGMRAKELPRMILTERR